jgi:ABC-type nitrate/sulfonate/bicarbonate transport system substrate-binding protein
LTIYKEIGYLPYSKGVVHMRSVYYVRYNQLMMAFRRKRYFREGHLEVCTCLLAIFLFSSLRLEAMEKVIITHSVGLSSTVAPLFYGIDRGFFKEQNIDLEYRILKTELGITALLNGEVDYSYSGGTGMRAAMRGLPIHVLSFDLERLTHYLMGGPNIKTANDLKGKRIGVSSFGASADLGARACLKSMGIDPTKDVTIIAMGSASIRYKALQAGAVAAIPVPLPQNMQMKKEGFNELCYAGRLFKGAVSGLVASIEKIKNKPEQVKGMLRGLLKTSRSLTQEKSRFVDFLVARLNLDRDIAEETAKVLVEGQTKDGIIEGSDLQKIIDSERRAAKIEKEVKPSDIFDYSLLREVLREENINGRSK